MNKSLLTNLIAVLLVIAGFLSPVYADVILSVGLFALSGAITNWLAVHMLFERVPFLYGSGVIENRFEEFKLAIRAMIMEQFFNKENLKRFISQEEEMVGKWFVPKQLISSINYDGLFQKLVEAIMESSFGGMLNMLGGAAALDKLKEPFIQKIQGSLEEMVEKPSFKAGLAAAIDSDKLSADMEIRINGIIEKRMEELTPAMVKELVQKMIREHLGWLVVWGGVFGGLIGFVVTFI